MRSSSLALAMILLAAAPLLAQQPPAPAPAPAPPTLDAVLAGWERAMTAVDKLYAEINQTVVDRQYQVTEVYVGVAKFLKPKRASLKLEKKTNPQMYQKFVYNGGRVFEFVPSEKKIRIHDETEAQQPGQVSDDTFLSFLLPGMKAAEVKKRYQLKLLPAPPPSDRWYYFLEVLPT